MAEHSILTGLWRPATKYLFTEPRHPFNGGGRCWHDIIQVAQEPQNTVSSEMIKRLFHGMGRSTEGSLASLPLRPLDGSQTKSADENLCIPLHAGPCLKKTSAKQFPNDRLSSLENLMHLC